MDKPQNDPKSTGRVLPEDVLNAAQDPNSMKDPLQQQLEKSQDEQTPEERESLERVRKQYGPDGNPEA